MRRSGALGIFSNYRDGITLADLRVDEGDEGEFWRAHLAMLTVMTMGSMESPHFLTTAVLRRNTKKSLRI